MRFRGRSDDGQMMVRGRSDDGQVVRYTSGERQVNHNLSLTLLDVKLVRL